MHQPPSAAQLLRTVADTLTNDAVPALTGPAQHRVRVAANIVEIVARELELGEGIELRIRDLDPSDRGPGVSTPVQLGPRPSGGF